MISAQEPIFKLPTEAPRASLDALEAVPRLTGVLTASGAQKSRSKANGAPPGRDCGQGLLLGVPRLAARRLLRFTFAPPSSGPARNPAPGAQGVAESPLSGPKRWSGRRLLLFWESDLPETVLALVCIYLLR